MTIGSVQAVSHTRAAGRSSRAAGSGSAATSRGASSDSVPTGNATSAADDSSGLLAALSRQGQGVQFKVFQQLQAAGRATSAASAANTASIPDK